MANWLTKMLPRWSRKAAEGQYRPGPYFLSDGWLSASAGKFMNWWQMGHSVRPYGGSNAMVEACVSAYSQTVAMCPGDHWTAEVDAKGVATGGRVCVRTSALSRIIRKPNDYQSMSDLLLNMTRRLYEKGEAFGLAIRNDRFEISEIHWMRNGQPVIAEDGSIFYWLGGNEIAERRFDLSMPIPARDVLHIRLHTPMHPLKGISPILAAALDLQLSGAALSQQVAFYLNGARPSIMLETEAKLDKKEADELRQRWDAQTKGDNAGGTPILSWGLKAKEIQFRAGDGQLADMLKMSDQAVALAFRTPLQILGIGGTPFASTEALMSSWKATGLGFCLNHIEEAFGQLFRLRGFPDEYLEFDTNAMMRSSFKELIDALSSGTRRLMRINEGRRFLDLPAVEGGDQILVQQQDIPLSMAGKVQNQSPAPANDPANDDSSDPPTDDAADAAKAVSIFRKGRKRAAIGP
ncbi:HK97 family phage portal protein [Bradyrhizobium ottawaense]|uniref:phage portal protein n=1 Tax=Bradyrhizobium ottawaense TaxID=931866 RepID=UPI0035143B69